MSPGITVTGVDASTTPEAISALLALHPAVEVGFLITEHPEGRHRYPSIDWLRSAMQVAAGRCALHVCGSGARRRLSDGELTSLTQHSPRIQVNGTVAAGHFTPRWIERICALHPTHTIITQHCAGNAALLDVPASNHALLVDSSGGNGHSPEAWARPDTGKRVGFAGGLGPHNLEIELSRIQDVADGKAYWVDMEGRLRNADDWFSPDLAAAAIRIYIAN